MDDLPSSFGIVTVANPAVGDISTRLLVDESPIVKLSSPSNVLSTTAETSVQLCVVPGWKISMGTERVKSMFCWAVPSATVRVTATIVSANEDKSPHTVTVFPSSTEYDSCWNETVTAVAMTKIWL